MAKQKTPIPAQPRPPKGVWRELDRGEAHEIEFGCLRACIVFGPINYPISWTLNFHPFISQRELTAETAEGAKEQAMVRIRAALESTVRDFIEAEQKWNLRLADRERNG